MHMRSWKLGLLLVLFGLSAALSLWFSLAAVIAIILGIVLLGPSCDVAYRLAFWEKSPVRGSTISIMVLCGLSAALSVHLENLAYAQMTPERLAAMCPDRTCRPEGHLLDVSAVMAGIAIVLGVVLLGRLWDAAWRWAGWQEAPVRRFTIRVLVLFGLSIALSAHWWNEAMRPMTTERLTMLCGGWPYECYPEWGYLWGSVLAALLALGLGIALLDVLWDFVRDQVAARRNPHQAPLA
jgi:hypothetical protein